MNTDIDKLASQFIEQPDAKLFEELYAHMLPELRLDAKRFNLVGHDTDDLVQISIINIWQKFKNYKLSTSFIGFTRQVGFRRMADLWKRIKQRGEKAVPQFADNDDPMLRKATKDDPLIWNLIFEEESAIQNGRRSNRMPPVYDRDTQNAEYRDYQRLKREVYGFEPIKVEEPVKMTKTKIDRYQRAIKRSDTGQVYADVYDAVRDINKGRTPVASKISLANAADFGYKCDKTKWSWANA